MLHIVKFICNTIYFAGIIIVLYFSTVLFFGSNEVINPEAMLPVTWRDQAFFWLAFGTVPMFLSCLSVYAFNGVRKKRNIIFIFLPGFICVAFVVGDIILNIINSFIFHGTLFR